MVAFHNGNFQYKSGRKRGTEIHGHGDTESDRVTDTDLFYCIIMLIDHLTTDAADVYTCGCLSDV